MMIKIEKRIEDVSDFNSYASDLWGTFLEELTNDEKFARPVDASDVEDGFPEDWTFTYTTRGQTLAERYRNRLHAVGEKHFPNDAYHIEIESGLYQEQ
jgi:hypothetical protein